MTKIMKRSTLLSMILAAGSLTVSASGYNYLAIERSNGASQTLTALGLTLSFADGVLTATNGTEKAVVTLTDLNRMYFTDTPSTDAGTTTAITAAEAATLSTTEEVYDLSGRRQPSGQALKKGVYVVRKNGNSTKIQVK